MKKMFAFVLSLVLMFSFCAPTYAEALSNEALVTVTGQDVAPIIYFSGTAWLSSSNFCTIVTSNNLLDDYPLVTSDGNNAGNVTIRVLNENGEIVGSQKTVSPGESVRLDKIPHDSGTYRIQGLATVEGTYSFVID